MKLLIVDDEPLARRRLRRMIEELPGVEVAGEAEDGIDALEQLAICQPDALLLDIHMPGLSGLELAAGEHDLPPIIFVTAYDKHALRAFELAAIDYILKPVSRARLAEAVGRLAERRPQAGAEALRRGLEAVFAALPGSERSTPPRISARVGDSVRLLDPSQVARFRASDKYSVCLHEGREWLVDESLSGLERGLAPLGFVRIHRGELVKLSRIVALHSPDGALEAELDDGQRAPVSRRLAANLRRRLGLV